MRLGELSIERDSQRINAILQQVSDRVVNVLEFGADPTGATDSAAVIREAIAVAQANGGGRVHLPRGTYIANTALTGLDDKVILSGDGRATKLMTTQPINLISCSTAGAGLAVQDMLLYGPSWSGTDAPQGVVHSGNGGILMARRLWIERFRTGLKFDGVSGTVAGQMLVEDCNLTTFEVGALHTGIAGSIFHSFKSSYTESKGTSGPNGDHGQYINLAVAYLSQNDRFYRLTGHGFNHSGGSGAAPYSKCLGSYFGTDDAVNRPTLLMTSSATRTLVEAGTFDSSLISIGGPCDIVSRNQFMGAVIAITNNPSVADVAIINNLFKNTSHGIAPGGGSTITDWVIRLNDFLGGSAGVSAFELGSTVQGKALFADNNVKGAYSYGTRINRGSGASDPNVAVVVDHNWFNMAAGSYPVYTEAHGSYPTEVWRNRVYGSTYPFRMGSLALNGALRGGDNYLSSEFLWGKAATYGYMAPGHGIGANIASATTITVKWNTDTYFVTGTTAIETINAQGSNANMLFDGRIYLIASGAWSTANTGNIRPKTTAARTVNDVVCLVHDPVNDLWYEN